MKRKSRWLILLVFGAILSNVPYVCWSADLPQGSNLQSNQIVEAEVWDEEMLMAEPVQGLAPHDQGEFLQQAVQVSKFERAFGVI